MTNSTLFSILLIFSMQSVPFIWILGYIDWTKTWNSTLLPDVFALSMIIMFCSQCQCHVQSTQYLLYNTTLFQQFTKIINSSNFELQFCDWEMKDENWTFYKRIFYSWIRSLYLSLNLSLIRFRLRLRLRFRLRLRQS